MKNLAQAVFFSLSLLLTGCETNIFEECVDSNIEVGLSLESSEDVQSGLGMMKDALIEYETIDSDQIDDIMNGKPPREPKDWSPDQNPPSSGAKVVDLGKDTDSTGSIGGPAEQH